MRHDAGALVGDTSHNRNIPMGNPGGGNGPYLSYVLSLNAEMTDLVYVAQKGIIGKAT